MGKMPEDQINTTSGTFLGGCVDDPLLSPSKSYPRSKKTENFFMEIPRQNDDLFLSHRNIYKGQ